MFEILENGQILQVIQKGKCTIKKHYGMEIEKVYDEDGNVIETKKFNLISGEYETIN